MVDPQITMEISHLSQRSAPDSDDFDLHDKTLFLLGFHVAHGTINCISVRVSFRVDASDIMEQLTIEGFFRVYKISNNEEREMGIPSKQRVVARALQAKVAR